MQESTRPVRNRQRRQRVGAPLARRRPTTMARQRQQHPSRLATLSWPLLCNLFLLALAPAARAVIVVPDTPLSFGASSNNATADGPHALVKRAPPSYDTFNGRATFFQPGLGACGQYSTASDYVRAPKNTRARRSGTDPRWTTRRLQLSTLISTVGPAKSLLGASRRSPLRMVSPFGVWAPPAC